MITKQVSVFLENKTGRLNEITQIVGDSGVNISAFSIADSSDFGVLRLITSDPEKAVKVLKENKCSVQTTDVVLMNCPNVPGALSSALNILSAEEVFIEYLYAFTMDKETAVIAIRPTNIEKCVQVLEKHRDELISKDNHYQI